MILTATCAITALTAPAPLIVVDATRQIPISPYIYGANHPDWDKLKTPFTLARQGGNRMTAYNWETNASNAGNDWRHQNDGYLGATDEPGWTARTFMNAAQKNGAAVILTVPTAGLVSADKGPDNDVNRTPNYRETRFHRSLPRKPGRAFAYPPNTRDRFVYQDEFVAWIGRVKAKNTPVWFSLDNEPDIWVSTHARIVPKAPGYADIIKNNTEFAAAIKSVAPRALVFGPANYGWQGFRTFQNAPDAKGRDFLDVYLTAMRAAERRSGKRLIDALDIHWYPEARGEGVRIAFGEDKPGTPAARIQAPRSLWDPTYVEDSWIAETLGKKPIVLLPNVKRQIDRNYPGTKFAITEYDFGGGKHFSGTLAQADVLGLFGRYGLFAACHWGVAPDRPAQVAGFRSFLNFDGRGARFGDLSLGVSGQRPAANSVYAALDRRNRRRATLVVVNKTSGASPTHIAFRGFRPKSVRAFVANPANPFTPRAVPAQVQNSQIRFDAPSLSVVTLEVRG